MAVTSLGLIGSATGSGGTMDIPITVDVPACDVATWREILVYGFAASTTSSEAVSIPTAVDDGPLTEPNVCWGLNPYGGGAALEMDNGSSTTPSGLEEFLGVQFFWAPAYQPLSNGGSTITITYPGDVYWAGALAIAIEGSTEDQFFGTGSQAFDHPSDGPGTPTPYSLSQSLTVDGFTTFGVFTMFQHYTTGVAALDFEEGGVTVEGSIYDSGAGHISIVLGTMALTPSASYGSGGDTDVGIADNPYGAVFPTIVPFGGDIFLYGDGGGLEPCPSGQVFGVQASVGDYV